MPLPPQFLDELRTRLPLSEVVGRRLRLTRAGREHKACCPFHKEKTPSFTVNDQKGFFHCFGCGAHGDIIGFVMQHDRASFLEAVELLAAQAGMPVPQATPEEHARFERRKSLHALIEAAAGFFEAQLHAPAGRAALDYLRRRGLDDETIARFRLGYAPADGQALLRALASQGFDEAAMIEAGLARRPEDGRSPYAFFRHRVMFPVADRRGRPVAFGGRLLEGDGPKYINSPDGPLFHKGQLLYGLSRARMAAGQGHTVIVAEGYMDVIALVRAGFQAAVAPLGTALTEAQIQELWTLAAVPVLCFDGDEAGRRAAWRAADRVLPQLKPDHSVRIAFLPNAEDPDSLLRRSGGAAAMRAVLEAALPLATVLWEREAAQHRLDTPEGRAGLKAALEALARQIADRTVQSFYLSEFNRRVFDAFSRRIQRSASPALSGAPGTPAAPSHQRLKIASPLRLRLETIERELTLLMIFHPSLFQTFDETFAGLPETSEENTETRRRIFDLIASDPEIDSETLIARLRPHAPQRLLDRIDRIRFDNSFLLLKARYLDPAMAEEHWLRLINELHQTLLREEIRRTGAAYFEADPEKMRQALDSLHRERRFGRKD